MSADDNSLVLRCQAGDQRAFKELVSRYQRRVYGIAFGVVRNPEDAMDVAQEAFIKVHRYLDRFKGSSSFYTWLYRIVVNLAIDHLRRRRKAQMVDYDDARLHGDAGGGPDEIVPMSLGADPDRALMRGELRAHLDAALDRLSANHRAVIMMREVEGLSYTEMAEAMSCSKGTIMSRLFHARRNLQGALLEIMGKDAPEVVHDRQEGAEQKLAEQA
ncbi:MAG: sigma-70 family RNA polymerase sigma factor, partial [Deltaproteobacteria bacterium]|nr:sigma-70 family RNA polymerase sigma factor [Deltaproteobacteria bacterium]